MNEPYDRLAALPRELWLPTLVTACGESALRLDHVRGWLAALVDGRLPDAALDFGDADALAPMRQAVGELALPALARGVPALAEQVLRTLCWHLDTIVERQPRLARDEAVAASAAAFRDEWQLEKSGWEEALALMQDLGDLAELRWDELRGRLNSREWREAQRLGALLAHLQPLVELIRGLGRAHHHPERPPAPLPPPGADPAPPLTTPHPPLAVPPAPAQSSAQPRPQE